MHPEQEGSEAQQQHAEAASPHAAAATAVLARAASMREDPMQQRTPQQSAASLFGAPPAGGGMYIARVSEPGEEDGSPASVGAVAVSGDCSIGGWVRGLGSESGSGLRHTTHTDNAWCR